MSKIDLTSFEDVHMTDKLLGLWLEIFRQSTGKFPESIVVTIDQAKKYFFSAGEMMTNYKGVPLEIQRKADELATVLKTIDGILTGMHTAAVKDSADVYRLLESMKLKLKGAPTNEQTGTI